MTERLVHYDIGTQDGEFCIHKNWIAQSKHCEAHIYIQTMMQYMEMTEERPNFFQQFIKTDIRTDSNLSQLSIWGLKIKSFSSLLIGEPS